MKLPLNVDIPILSLNSLTHLMKPSSIPRIPALEFKDQGS